MICLFDNSCFNFIANIDKLDYLKVTSNKVIKQESVTNSSYNEQYSSYNTNDGKTFWKMIIQRKLGMRFIPTFNKISQQIVKQTEVLKNNKTKLCTEYFKNFCHQLYYKLYMVKEKV